MSTAITAARAGKTAVLDVSKSWTPAPREGSAGQHAAMDLDGGHRLHVAFLVLQCGVVQRFVSLGNERLGCCQGFQHLLVPVAALSPLGDAPLRAAMGSIATHGVP